MRIKLSAIFYVLSAIGCVTLTAATKPNIVFLYVDDWAWSGTPIAMDEVHENSRMPILQMPNLTKMAEQGMKFRNAYGGPQCAPARVSIQTGQSAPRSGYTLVLGKIKDDYYDMRKQWSGLPLIPNVSDTSIKPDAVTIPEVLKPLGYASAHVGKWHMYSDPGAEGYIVHDGDTTNTPGNTIKSGGKQIPADMTDPKLMFSMAEKALGFIEDQAKANKPFYLQMSYYSMHAGSECLPATREKYANMPEVKAYYERTGQDPNKLNRKSDPAVWFGMGEDMDTTFGMILDKLEALGIAENTYVVMAADNGYRHKELLVTEGMTQPLHAHKWWAWDGGIRVPMIVTGPGIPAGTTFEGNVVNYDFLPTFFEWAGGDPETLENIDGISLAGYMAGEKPDETFLKRPLYFHVPHYRSEIPHSAIISGNQKVMHFYDSPDTPMLFDLSQDPGEVENIATVQPEDHQALLGQMMSYFEEVGARIPKKNPDFDPEKYKSNPSYKKYIAWGAFEGSRPLADDEK
ncbi:MAG: sulfatase-like hydrolase/transferase [Verrucomicrobiota bacterium]